MPLNLEQRANMLTCEDLVCTESYKVYPTHPAYQFIWHVGLSINAMTTAICAIEKQPIPEDGHLGLACKARDIIVQLPAHSMVRRAKEQSAGDSPWIEVSLVWRKEPGKNDGWAKEIRAWMWLTVAAGFVHFFEEHKTEAYKRNHKVAKMAKVIRDSCAHGLKVTCSKSGGAELNGLKLTSEDHGKPLSDYFGLGDFFVLALRMISEPS